MNTLSIGFLMAFAMTSAMAANTPIRYHRSNLFVKMKAGQTMIKSPLISSSKRLIGDLYLVKSDDLNALSHELNNAENVEFIERDQFAGKKALPKHESLQVNALLKAMIAPLAIQDTFNDPQVKNLWAFSAKNGMDVLGAYATLPAGNPRQVIVAVVDTGVDHNHDDLKDVMWTNPREIPKNGIDDDKNGYIDDIHGINTLVRDENGKATMNTQASHWHGTHVAGTIAASQNNGKGIAGVASNARIMAIRTVPDEADELDSDVVEAYIYAAKNGAKVINCSFGKEKNEGGMAVRDVMTEIGKKFGVLLVVSAGNDSDGPDIWHNNDVQPKYPASYDSPNMIVIASTTIGGELSGFSNIGPTTVDIASPGSDILSTMPKNRYAPASGTSMAAPNLSGVAAMVIGYNPSLKAAGVKQILMASVVKVPAFEGKMLSGGRVNLKQALQMARRVR